MQPTYCGDGAPERTGPLFLSTTTLPSADALVGHPYESAPQPGCPKSSGNVPSNGRTWGSGGGSHV